MDFLGKPDVYVRMIKDPVCVPHFNNVNHGIFPKELIFLYLQFAAFISNMAYLKMLKMSFHYAEYLEGAFRVIFS